MTSKKNNQFHSCAITSTYARLQFPNEHVFESLLGDNDENNNTIVDLSAAAFNVIVTGRERIVHSVRYPQVCVDAPEGGKVCAGASKESSIGCLIIIDRLPR